MTNLAFAPEYNTEGKRDATGAFQPEASYWCRSLDSGGVILIDNRQSKKAMRETICFHIEAARPTRIALFCHGWSTGIQFGFGIGTVNQLAEAMASVACNRLTLYCCSTGSGPGTGGDNGFADAMRDALCQYGETWCAIDAHTTAGHCTRNPYVRRFEGMGSSVGGVGGYWLVAPGSVLWPRWKLALRDTTLRFTFPTMTVAEIHDMLKQRG